MKPRPEDDPHATQSAGAGVVGMFPGTSIWPFTLGMGVFLRVGPGLRHLVPGAGAGPRRLGPARRDRRGPPRRTPLAGIAAPGPPPRAARIARVTLLGARTLDARVIRWRVLVVGLWVVVVVSALASTRLPALLTTSLSVPGSSSSAANDILVRHFGENIEGTFTVVIDHVTPGAQRDHDALAIAEAARSIPGATISQERLTFGVLYANVTTTLPLAHAAGAPSPCATRSRGRASRPRWSPGRPRSSTTSPRSSRATCVAATPSPRSWSPSSCCSWSSG